MSSTRLFRPPCLAMLGVALLALPVFAAPVTVDLSAEASRPALNDLSRATVSAEDAGATPGPLAAQVNRQIDAALKTAKAYPTIKIQSGGTSTYPVYGKAGKIDSWRMRSELALESKDFPALSELLGKLQATLAVSNLMLQPATDTRKKAEDEATIDALGAFNARAKVIADSMGRPYHIKQLSVNVGGHFPQPMFRAQGQPMAMAAAAPMPVEAGDSQVSVTVTGQIEVE